MKIDSRLEKIDTNYEEKIIKAQSIIGNWRARPMTIHGRLTIAKTLILSQFTYIATILDLPSTAITERIQNLMNKFITNPMKEEDEKEKKWLSTKLLYTNKAKGGLAFVKFVDFVKSVKCSWVRRYTEGCNDLWCDILDSKLQRHPGNRHEILSWGDREFDKIINEQTICLSSIFKCLADLNKAFLTEPEAMDNRWLEQAVFKNSNIQAKIANRLKAGYQTKPISQTYYNLPDNLRLRIIDLYEGGKFKPRESLELTIQHQLMDETFSLAENSHILLKTHFSEIIGGQRRHGAKRRYDNVIPIKKKELPEHTLENLNQLFKKCKKGSKHFRRIFNQDTNLDLKKRSESWEKTLSTENIDKDILRNAFRTVNWTALGNDICDSRLRLLTRKTLFNNQIAKMHAHLEIKPIWTKSKYCERCLKAGIDAIENLPHAMTDCTSLGTNISTVLKELNLIMPNQQLNYTQSILWVSTLGENPDNKNLLTLMNYILMLTQHLTLKSRFYQDDLNTEMILNEVKRRFTILKRTKPGHLLCGEIIRLKLEHLFFHNVRPPDLY